MSNNNPHGHISQPTQNPSWNHLQIPSYIPRQPQLAHMSNERPMVRSPSAWHAPAPPPDSLYNFMSANHKNLEHQMNSLLPRSLLPPFDSMDLSLQSSRSSSSPLNKAVGGHAPGMLPHEYGGHKHATTPQPSGPPPPHQHQQHPHQQQQQQQQQQQGQSQLHGPNSYPIHNLSSNSPSSLAQQQHQQQSQSQHAHHSQLSALQSSPATHGMQSATPQSPASPAASQGPGKYMNTNGNDCEGMLPPSGTNPGGPTSVGGNNNNGGGSGGTGNGGGSGGGPSPVHPYMREPNDAPTHMGDSYGKVSHLARNYETDLQSKGASSKPVELVSKDCNYPSLISNKMPSHTQQTQQQHQQSQVSPKKHSPMRTYHAQQQHQHHHQQQQQQQQQHQSSFNNPSQSTMKHNGPHTPPTPQSPVMHQQSGGPLHGMDYNQMHLQQQPPPQSSYPHQQQQHMSQHLPPPPPQHALHYPPHPHAHPHSHSLLPQQSAHQQQQPTSQLSQQNQPHHVSTQQQHIHPPMHQTQQHHHQVSPRMHQHHQHQQQQQQSMQPQQQNSSPPMRHTLSAHLHRTNSSNVTRPDDMAPVASNASNTSSYNMHSTEKKKSSPHGENAVIADLSPAAIDTTANIPFSTSGACAPSCIPDSAESPSPEAVSSHCESLDSNSNSSGGGGASFRQRLQKRGSIEAKSSGTEHEAADFGNVLMPAQGRGDALQRRQQLPRNNIPRTPKSSPPEQMRRSPRKADSKSPTSNLTKSPPTATANLGTPFSLQEKMPTASTPTSPTSQTMENGRIPTASTDTNSLRTMAEAFADSEVETIDKISAMIASTANDSTPNMDANSNSSVKSIGERENSVISSGSPKTKKQRQALKLRNASEYNSNSNGSSNSYGAIGNAPSRCMTMSDNAVAVDELRKELMRSELQQTDETNGIKSAVAHSTKTDRDSAASISLETETDTRIRHPPPLSPQSNSHSSSSSSSSSSCSNSSHSSIGSKTATKAGKVSGSQCTVIASTASAVEDGNKTTRQAQVDNKTSSTLADNEPLNLNALKTDTVTASFEEVENKLEEMFAGIEDEPIIPEPEDIVSQAPANATEVVRDLSLALELSTNTSTQHSAPTSDEAMELNQSVNACVKDMSAPLHVRTDGPPPTKAAKKSTLPSPVRKPAAETPPDASSASAGAVQNADEKKIAKESDAALAAVGRRNGPPRRRLSVAMDPANLRIMLGEESDFTETRPQRAKRAAAAKRNNNNTDNSGDHSKEVICLDDDDDQPSTSAAAAAALAAKTMVASTAKEAASHAVGGSGANAKATPKNAKGGKAQDTRKRPSRANDVGKNGGKKKLTGKQQQRRKQQQNSSEDEAPAAPSSSAVAEQIKNKSPFILVKRDGSISVVNAPLNAEDVNEKHSGSRLIKKPAGAAGYAHDRKNLRGLHSSTLSNKYDADTTDSTWICVFCKRGPHRMGLGDLFGPYLVTVDCEEYKAAVKAPDALDLDAIFVSKRRRIDMVQTNPRNLPVMAAKNSAAEIGTTIGATRTSVGGKKKKKSMDTSMPGALNSLVPVIDPLDCSADEALQHNFLGMSKVSETSYEVWLHEDCIVWAPDVFLVGVRVMGLDAAVWNSTHYHCTLCSKPGAIVCCLQRDCKATAHVPCAREAGWNLNESTMNVHCQKHATTNAVQTTVAATTTITTPAVTSSAAVRELQAVSSGRQSDLKNS